MRSPRILIRGLCFWRFAILVPDEPDRFSGGDAAATIHMLDPVGSTSWHNRHLGYFRRLGELLAGPARPVVLIVGPGAVTRLTAPLLNDSARPGSAIRKLIGDAARYSDQLLRRIPGMPLRSLEPLEVEAALKIDHDLIVADRSRRVLAAVARDVPTARCVPCDLSLGGPGVVADAVIAFNIVCRLERPAEGMRHLIDCVRPGGLLLIDDRSAEAHLPKSQFVEIAPKTHRRTD